MSDTMTKNRAGQWVPAIPEPFHGFFYLKCSCGKMFWTTRDYREHYALDHVLDGQPTTGEKE